MKDLFGNEVELSQMPVIDAKPKTVKKGYARPPGTGPAGETCKGCAHAVRRNGGVKDYWKCDVIRHRWTGGPGTDIKLRSPACSMFLKK